MYSNSDSRRNRVWRFASLAGAILALAAMPRLVGGQTPQVIEVLADHDSRYKIAGMKDPVSRFTRVSR